MGSVDLVGYKPCRDCGDLFEAIALGRLGGVCWKCLAKLDAAINTVELQIAGAVVPYKVRRRHSGSRGSSVTKHQVAHANMAALRRLRDLFPDLFDLLLQAERAKRGLEPFPISAACRQLDVDQLEETISRLVATWTESGA